ncbi:hypothetical protein TNIN_419651, partial [Trichonephila inaurata madagascariensis]
MFFGGRSAGGRGVPRPAGRRRFPRRFGPRVRGGRESTVGLPRDEECEVRTEERRSGTRPRGPRSDGPGRGRGDRGATVRDEAERTEEGRSGSDLGDESWTRPRIVLDRRRDWTERRRPEAGGSRPSDSDGMG